jgi:ribosomal protein S27E
MTEKEYYDIQDVLDAGFLLMPIKCRFCGSLEVVFSQKVMDACCQSCDRWQLDEESDECS